MGLAARCRDPNQSNHDKEAFTRRRWPMSGLMSGDKPDKPATLCLLSTCGIHPLKSWNRPAHQQGSNLNGDSFHLCSSLEPGPSSATSGCQKRIEKDPRHNLFYDSLDKHGVSKTDRGRTRQTDFRPLSAPPQHRPHIPPRLFDGPQGTRRGQGAGAGTGRHTYHGHRWPWPAFQAIRPPSRRKDCRKKSDPTWISRKCLRHGQ